MLGILIKQNIRGMIEPMMINPKDGKRRSKSYLLVIFAVYAIVFGNVGITMGAMAKNSYASFVSVNADWAYFVMMGSVGMSFAMIMTSVITYAILYMAKDNSILLALPIKPGDILLSRLLSCEISTLTFVSLSLLPGYIVYLQFAPFNVNVLIGVLCMIILLSIVGLSIAGLLGFLMALIASRLKKKNFATVVLALVFVIIYSYVNTKFTSSIDKIVLFAEASKQTSIVWLVGNAFLGNGKSLLLILAFTAVLAFLCYELLEKTFFGLVSFKKGFKKNKLKASMIKENKGDSYLLKREFDHIFGSVNYLLNTAFGSFITAIGAIVVAVFAFNSTSLLESWAPIKPYFEVIVLAGSLLCCTMNDIASVVISVESKNFWIIKSLPLDSKKILMAKLELHFIMTAVPTFLMAVAASAFFRLNALVWFFTLTIPLLYSLFSGFVGIAIDLKHPKITWESEVMICKQSLTVLADMAINFFGTVIILGIGFVLMMFINKYVGFGFIFVFYLIFDLLLFKWLTTKGVTIFNSL